MKIGRFALFGGLAVLVILFNLYQSRTPSPAPEESAPAASASTQAGGAASDTNAQATTQTQVTTGGDEPGAAASGPERYTNMNVALTVDADAAIVVKEEITAVVQGEEIRHGITRDIPLVRHHRWFNSVSDIDVLGATINGQSSAYDTAISGQAAQIRIGDPNVLLKPGVYTFTLTYKLDRQIGYFDNFDEIYWNVIGTGFEFTTEKAAAVVTLPQGAPVRHMAAYTGTPDDSSRHGATFSKGPNDTVRFETTRPILPGEAFTIAVSWPKGFVADPGRWERLIGNPYPILIALATLVGTSLYFLVAWWQVGRDPPIGPQVPVYAPTLPPHAMRFLEQRGYDPTCLVAAIMNICAKGHARMVDDPDDPKGALLIRAENDALPLRKPLSVGEQAVFDVLLADASGGVVLGKANRSLIFQANEALKTSMEDRFAKGYFDTNIGLFVIGALVIGAGMLASTAWEERGLGGGGFFDAGMFAVGAASLMATLYVVGAFLLRRLAGRRDRGWFDRTLARGVRFIWPFAILGIAVSGPNYLNSVGLLPVLLLLLALLVLFIALSALPRRTARGQTTMDEVRGTRLYITVAEADRLKFDNPPDRTPRHYSDLLPYAVALGVETAWTKQFAAILLAGSAAVPTWYHGTHWNSAGWSSGSNPVAGGIGAAVASQRQAISGASGSGGGGFSGGGGGGGGSGGW